MNGRPLDQRRGKRLRNAFRQEVLAGFRLATQARIVALAVIAVCVQIWVEPPRSTVLEIILLVFVLIGVGHYLLARGRYFRSWQSYLFVALDFALLTLATIGLPFLVDSSWPPQMALRDGTIVYYFLILAILGLSYVPRLMLWAGLAAAGTWSLGNWFILRQPDTLTTAGHEALSPEAHLASHLDPRFMNLDAWQQDVVLLMLVAAVLACVVWRGKRLVERQTAIERERGNLARYFSPNMVDQLAQQDEPLGAVRSQPVAVLFADVVGFTQISEALAPETVIGLLREFQSRMAAAVFEHDGTVDKYIGDAIMATFGTPLTGPRDARNALACARAMVAAVAAWNRERWESGSPPIRIGIGVHFGPAVLGDIGDERRLEFAVIGDTVNVASRLEGLTRDLGVDIAVSDELVRQVKVEDGNLLLDGFAPGAPQSLRNRSAPLGIWTWRDT